MDPNRQLEDAEQDLLEFINSNHVEDVSTSPKSPIQN
jgi:hypothetical protein